MPAASTHAATAGRTCAIEARSATRSPATDELDAFEIGDRPDDDQRLRELDPDVEAEQAPGEIAARQ